MKLREIASLVGGTLAGGDETEILRVAKIEEAGTGDITFLANLKYKKHLATTGASAVLIAADAEFEELGRRSEPIHCVRVADPYSAFLRLIGVFHPPVQPPAPGIHPTAVIGEKTQIAPGVYVGPHVCIGNGCSIGTGTYVYAGTVLADQVVVGEHSILSANVTVREQCRIGDRVIIHSGAVIGSDGFGFAPQPDGRYEKIPQRGIVVVGDDVEIGANCTIDRATIGETRIGRGVKLDNLIQIAHNVSIGENTVIAAQTGISGSTSIGNNCAIAGQVGTVGHIHIADRTTIGAQSGIHKGITEPGKTWFGYPARELHEQLRIEAVIRQLPELLRTIRELQTRIGELGDEARARSSSIK
jgi:UDP-3-O-[3-hydroxymyristoyl] glucosamine N-acyltransferase